MHPTLRRWTAALAVAVAVCGGLLWNTRRANAATREAAASAASTAASVAAEAVVRDADIAFYERRIAEDPASSIDRTRLGELLVQRARASNDYRDFLRAEAAARASLA